MQGETFQLLVDGVPYIVKTIPYDFNREVRFRVSYNEGPEHIFYLEFRTEACCCH